MMETLFLLFPGRHHVLTRFQADYLRRWPGVTIVWAVTSANHENTKRNPVPYHRREAAIERFSVLAGLRSVVVPVFDTAPTDRFAEVTLKNITVATGLDLSPENTVVACSTPQVAALYEALGFTIAGVEAEEDPVPARPWDVLLQLAAGDEGWRERAHPATANVFDSTSPVQAVVRSSSESCMRTTRPSAVTRVSISSTNPRAAAWR